MRSLLLLVLLSLVPLGTENLILAQENLNLSNKDRAIEYEAKEQFYNAIGVWQRMLQDNPNNSRAYYGIARSYMHLNQYREALKFVEKAQLLDNQDFEIMTLKSRILMGLGNYDKAKEMLLKLKKQDISYQIDLALAEVYAVLGDVATSIQYLNSIQKFAADNLEFLLISAMIYEKAGRLDAADRFLRQALDFQYNEAIVHKIAVGYYLRHGRYDEVVEQIDIVKRLGIDTEELRLQGLEATYLNGAYQLTINLAKTMLDLFPKNYKAWYLLGLAYKNTGQLEPAMDALDTARRIKSGNELVSVIIAEILRTTYPYPSERHSREAERYIARAKRKRENLFYDDALQDYRLALQLDPMNEKNWMAFANVFRDRGNYAKYLDKLYAWKRFGISDKQDSESLRQLDRLIAIYESSQPQSVAHNWDVDQYSYSNDFYPVQVFIIKNNILDYIGAQRELGSYFINALQRFEQPTVVGEIRLVSDHLEAQQAAYDLKNSDYYIVLDLNKQEGRFLSEISLHLSATGSIVGKFDTEQISPGKIYDAFALLAQQLHAAFPKKARVIRATNNHVVLSMGSLDGVELGQQWQVLPEGSLSLSPEKPFAEYEQSKVIGTLIIGQRDERVSMGKVDLDFFTKPVKEGQIAVLLPDENTQENQENQGGNQEEPKTRFIQEPDLQLQNRLFELS